MSKKTNSLIFMVIATIVNVVILLVFCVVGLLLLNALAGAFPESPLIPALIILVFLGVILLSFFTYSKLVKWLNKRFNLEDKMDPLFSGGRNRRGKTD